MPRLMAQMSIGDIFVNIFGILEFSKKIGNLQLTCFSPQLITERTNKVIVHQKTQRGGYQ